MEETTITPNATETTTEQTQTPEAGSSWLWGQDLPGNGDKPEWFKGDKYKTVADQAQAYVELEKRFGGFIGAPKDGYQFGEELGELSQDPALQAVLPVLQESNASNEFVSKLVTTYAQAQQQLVEQKLQAERQALGENAEARLKAVADFAKGNLPSELFEDFAPMITSAKSVQVFEALMQKMNGSAIAPKETVAKPSITESQLTEMLMAKDENGNLKASVDMNYRRQVDEMYKNFYRK